MHYSMPVKKRYGKKHLMHDLPDFLLLNAIKRRIWPSNALRSGHVAALGQIIKAPLVL